MTQPPTPAREYGAGGASSSAPAGRQNLVVLILAVLATLLVATGAVLGVVVHDQRSGQADRRELAAAQSSATAAAGQLILNLDALSAPTIDRDFALVVAGSTGTFNKQFTRSEAQLKSYIKGQKITSKGELVSTGLVRSDTDTATVIVAVDRTFKDSTHPSGVVAHDRWKLDLERHSGRWLVAVLEPVS